MSNYLKVRKFSEIDINDPFFDSLKSDYAGFEDWFSRKAEKKAYILEDNGVQGFLYFKKENGVVDDVNPRIIADDILKIGTIKVNPHGTRLGERFIKKAFDHAVKFNSDIVYVTVFKKHQALVNLFLKYGFKKHVIL
jgi:L-amino acid N-acyltransferase YncA